MNEDKVLLLFVF